jgi:hypothetical protein
LGPRRLETIKFVGRGAERPLSIRLKHATSMIAVIYAQRDCIGVGGQNQAWFFRFLLDTNRLHRYANDIIAKFREAQPPSHHGTGDYENRLINFTPDSARMFESVSW